MSDWDNIASIANDVNSGRTSAVDLVEKSLNKIEENSEYNAIIVSLSDSARKRAKKIDGQIKNGENAGKLAGVPFIAKDNFLVLGGETTAASHMLKGFVAPYQSTVINLLEAEGAICVAKANLDAFAHGSSTENSDFGPTLNPIDKARAPGGSSGGSAASVALDMAPFSLGTDTGGSIRLPASFCGVVGYKPTYGLVSRSGVVAMASSLDVIGPLTQNVQDAAYVLDVIAAQDKLDSTTLPREEVEYADLKMHDLKGLKIGIIKEFHGDGVDKGVSDVVENVVDLYKANGAEVSEVSIPTINYALAVYYVLCPAELSSNLSRHDGQRYRFYDETATTLDESYEGSRSKGFGDEAKRRIMIGAYVLSSGFYDAYYQKAQLVRTKLINEFHEVFKKYDILISAVAPTPAFELGKNVSDPLQMYLTDIMTVGANIVGSPAVSVPGGFSEGLPVGIHLTSAYGKDKLLLEVAKITETLVSGGKFKGAKE